MSGVIKLDSPEDNDTCTKTTQDCGFNLIPTGCLTPDTCLTAVTVHGPNIQYVPLKFLTHKLCEIAVSQNGLAILYLIHMVPHLISPKLCEIAVSQNGFIIQYLIQKAPHLITPRLCEIAVSQDGLVLRCIVEGIDSGVIPFIIHANTYLIAIKNNWYSIKYIPEKDLTPELCEVAINIDAHAIRCISDDFIRFVAPHLPELAINKLNSVIEIIPKEFLTPELLISVIKNNIGSIITRIPDDLMKTELCMAIVKNRGTDIQYIKTKFLNVPICEEAVNNNCEAFHHISIKFITLNMCKTMVKASIENFKYIPYKYRQEIKHFITTIMNKY